jgi:hypothetical protein
MSNELTESFDFDYKIIQEDSENNEGKKLTKLRGLFQQGGVKNGNGRVYPTNILEAAVKSNLKKVEERHMLGELDHPSDGKIHLEKVSHVVTGLNMSPEGRLEGELEVFDGPIEEGGTPAGQILGSFIKRGVKLGISSRGFGSTKQINGVNEVQNDYKLITFDIVSDPSTPDAYPTPVFEDQEVDSWKLEKKETKKFSELLQENLED